MTPRRVLMIHPEGNAGNNPTIKCLIDLLIESNFKITYISSGESSVPFRSGLTLIKRSKMAERLKRKIFNKYCEIWLSKFFSCVRNLHLLKKYDLIISIDREGLIEASAISSFYKIPLIHASFEIYFESETSIKYKAIEIEASKNISFWIAQDKIRAQSLIAENKLESAKGILIPVSSKGPCEASNQRLRDDLGIPLDKKVAIFMGSLYPWTLFKEVLNQAHQLPSDWVLVINERYGHTQQYFLEQKIDYDLLQKKVYLSQYPVEFVDEMGYILSGIDAGLAFYRPSYNDPSNGLNLFYLGLSSGKISTYLRYGVPIVINEIGLFADLTREHKFGVVIESPDKLPNALLDLDNMQNASHNAKKFFSDQLDFSLYQDEIKSVIDSLVDMPD